MAERRMFAKTIVDSDFFVDMIASAQALYFHLSMNADDDGFVNNPNKIACSVGCSSADLKLLVEKRFIIEFPSGIIVIKHWKINNYLRSDRHHPTVYCEEMSMLEVKENGAYTLRRAHDVPTHTAATTVTTDDRGIPTHTTATEYSILKSSKNRLSISTTSDEVVCEPQGASPVKCEYTQIVDLFNVVCASYPRVKSVSEARKKAIRARLRTYTVEDIKLCFEKAEASSFLKGKNDRNWSANFDWLLRDRNMARVLDGNYDDKPSGGSGGTGSYQEFVDDLRRICENKEDMW